MKRRERSSWGLAIGLLVGLGLAIGGCATAPRGGEAAPAGAPKATIEAAGPAKTAAGFKYVCNCGTSCDCDTMADKPGDCTCGKPMVYRKIVREDSSYYWVCLGGSDNAVSKDDPFKCTDGKPLQALLKKGRYVCACKDCDCGTVSQKPGNCVCGKLMKPAP